MHQETDGPAEDGVHVTWTHARWLGRWDGTGRSVSSGAQVILRDGPTVLATAEYEAPRSDLHDGIEDEAHILPAWIPTLRELAAAVGDDRAANGIRTTCRLMLSHWEASKGGDLAPVEDAYDQARTYAHALRDLVPEELQRHLHLHEAVEQHAQALTTRATDHRVRAVHSAPDAPRLTLAWTGPYSEQQCTQIRRQPEGEGLWYADIPLQLLHGWREKVARSDDPHATRKPAPLRDHLITWAFDCGASKIDIARAGGMARTTVNRLLNGSGVAQ